MPKEIFQCIHEGCKEIFTIYDACRWHERNCEYNPERRTCLSCIKAPDNKHNKLSLNNFCNINRDYHYKTDCEKWKGKNQE